MLEVLRRRVAPDLAAIEVAGLAGREPDAALPPVGALEAHEAGGALVAPLLVDARRRAARRPRGRDRRSSPTRSGSFSPTFCPVTVSYFERPLTAEHLQLAAAMELAAVVGDVAVEAVGPVVLGHVDDARLRVDRAGLVEEPPHRLDRLRLDRAGGVLRDLEDVAVLLLVSLVLADRGLLAGQPGAPRASGRRCSCCRCRSGPASCRSALPLLRVEQGRRDACPWRGGRRRCACSIDLPRPACSWLRISVSRPLPASKSVDAVVMLRGLRSRRSSAIRPCRTRRPGSRPGSCN